MFLENINRRAPRTGSPCFYNIINNKWGNIKPPEGAAHRKPMPLEKRDSFSGEWNPGGRCAQETHAFTKSGVIFQKTKPPEGAAHRKPMLLENQVSFFQKINPRRAPNTGKPCLYKIRSLVSEK